MANNEYTAGKAGGRVIITMPSGTDGTKYKRSVWKDGTIMFKPIKN